MRDRLPFDIVRYLLVGYLMPAWISLHLLSADANHARFAKLSLSPLRGDGLGQPVRGPRRCPQLVCQATVLTAHERCRWAVGGPPRPCDRLSCSLLRRSVPDVTRWRARLARRRCWIAAEGRSALLKTACSRAKRSCMKPCARCWRLLMALQRLVSKCAGRALLSSVAS